MEKLIWDLYLEIQMSEQARTCRVEPDAYEPYFGNLSGSVTSITHRTKKRPDIVALIDKWTAVDCNGTNIYYDKCTPYRNILGSSERRVACALQDCNDTFVMYCGFYPALANPYVPYAKGNKTTCVQSNVAQDEELGCASCLPWENATEDGTDCYCDMLAECRARELCGHDIEFADPCAGVTKVSCLACEGDAAVSPVVGVLVLLAGVILSVVL